MLAEAIKSGKIVVSQDNTPQIEIEAKNKKIKINALDKKLIKEVVASARESGTKGGVRESIQRSIGGIRTARNMQPVFKEIVEDLCREGVTITVSYKGNKVATIGSEANSKVTRLVTGTKGVEINSPTKLAEMTI